MREVIRRQAEAWGMKLDPDRVAGLERYAQMLAGYEEANVIGTREVADILLDHVLDSLSCGLFGPVFEAEQLADVGAGGGLPGVPLKILVPRLELTLIEATAKKVRFLRRVAEELSLTRCEVLNDRVEQVGRMREHRGSYDVATVRAVARLPTLAEYCVPLLRVGGHAISMKGRLQDQELAEGAAAAKEVGARISEVIKVPFLPEVGEKERRLVVIEKVSQTPNRYPRRVGTPAKKPLGVV